MKLAAKITQLNLSAKQKLTELNLLEFSKDSLTLQTELEARVKSFLAQNMLDVDGILCSVVKVSRARFQREYEKICKLVGELPKAPAKPNPTQLTDTPFRREEKRKVSDGPKSLTDSEVQIGNGGGRQLVKSKGAHVKLTSITASESMQEKYESLKKQKNYPPLTTKHVTDDAYSGLHEQEAHKNKTLNHDPDSLSPRQTLQREALTEREPEVNHDNHFPADFQSNQNEGEITELHGKKVSTDVRTPVIGSHSVLENMNEYVNVSHPKRSEFSQQDHSKKVGGSSGSSNATQPIINDFRQTNAAFRISGKNSLVIKNVTSDERNAATLSFNSGLASPAQGKIYTADLWKAYDLMGLEGRPIITAHRPEFKRAQMDKIYFDLTNANADLKKARDRYYNLHIQYLKRKTVAVSKNESPTLDNDGVNPSSTTNAQRLKHKMNPKLSYLNSVGPHKPSKSQNPSASFKSEPISRDNAKVASAGLEIFTETAKKFPNPRPPALTMYEPLLDNKFPKRNNIKMVYPMHSPSSKDIDHNAILENNSIENCSTRGSSFLREQREKKIEMRYLKSKEIQFSRDIFQESPLMEIEKPSMQSPSFRENHKKALTLSDLHNSLEQTEKNGRNQQAEEEGNPLQLPKVSVVDGSKVFPQISSPTGGFKPLVVYPFDLGMTNASVHHKHLPVKVSATPKKNESIRITGLDDKDFKNVKQRFDSSNRENIMQIIAMEKQLNVKMNRNMEDLEWMDNFNLKRKLKKNAKVN